MYTDAATQLAPQKLPVIVESKLNSTTGPEHLRAMAALYGFDAPCVEAGRVLVLGCGDCTGLLPYVLANPDAQIVAIDIDNDAIEQGNALLEVMKVGNVQLHCLQLDALLGFDVGEQDYILIDGLFALLDNASRDAIVGYGRQFLQPDGVMLIHWPCYPGAKKEEAIRDAMLLHSSMAATSEEQISSARAMATYLTLGASADAQQNNASLLKQIDDQSDITLSLRYLAGINEASYFVDFNTMIEAHGLTYLGDAQAWTELPEHYGENVKLMHENICPANNKILKQQYLDFAVNRQSRYSLLVQANHAEKIEVLPNLDVLQTLNWAGNFQRYFANEGTETGHLTWNGKALSTSHEISLTVMDLLGEVWPFSLSFDEIAHHTAIPGKSDQQMHRQLIANLFRSLFISGGGIVQCCKGTDPYRRHSSRQLRPLMGLHALIDHPGKEQTLFNFWYQPLQLTASESLIMLQDSVTVTADNVGDLTRLRKKGLLTGSVHAWQTYFQQLVTFQDLAGNMLDIVSLLMFANHIAHPRTREHLAPASRLQLDDLNEKQAKKLQTLFQQQEFRQALSFVQQHLKARPQAVMLWYKLSQVHFAMQDFSAALEDFRNIFALEASDWVFYQQLVPLLMKRGLDWQAKKLAMHCLRNDDSVHMLWTCLARLAMKAGNNADAHLFLTKAIALAPRDVMAVSTMGTLLSDQSRIDEALPWLRKACELAPSDMDFMTNYLFALLHHEGSSASTIFSEHQRFGRQVTLWAKNQRVKFSGPANKDPERKLRIGFISGDLREHPVANFILPIWSALDDRYYEVYAYQNLHQEDAVSRQLAQKCTGWNLVGDCSPVELARKINDDGIDVLIDLSGHTNYNRLPVFGLRPAPVSMSFIGYPGTTGLNEMDYYLVHNKQAAPGELESQFSEALIYLPFNQQFTLFHDAPAVAPTPALANGWFTFGSFNRPNKINDAVIDCWIDVLKRNENSRMLIGNIMDDDMATMFINRFTVQGIDESRLIIRKRSDLHGYLTMHGEVDLLLDAFPYPGGTTTNYALQMGVPTLTMVGDTLVTRQGAANMRQFNLDSFVVSSVQEYVQRATEICADPNGLNELRLGLRQRIEERGRQGGNPACYLERAIRMAWRRYCEGLPADSFVVAE